MIIIELLLNSTKILFTRNDQNNHQLIINWLSNKKHDPIIFFSTFIQRLLSTNISDNPLQFIEYLEFNT